VTKGASFWSVQVPSSLKFKFLKGVWLWLSDLLGLGVQCSIKCACIFQILWFCGVATEDSFLLPGSISDFHGNTRYSYVMLWSLSSEAICNIGRKCVLYLRLFNRIFFPIEFVFLFSANISSWAKSNTGMCFKDNAAYLFSSGCIR